MDVQICGVFELCGQLGLVSQLVTRFVTLCNELRVTKNRPLMPDTRLVTVGVPRKGAPGT